MLRCMQGNIEKIVIYQCEAIVGILRDRRAS